MALGDERRASGRANEAARRAIGTNNEAARRATGTNNEAARRGGGAAMVERRRGSTVVEDVNSIITQTRKTKPLRTVDPVGAVPARTSPGLPQAYAPAKQGGGIASPLTEASYAARSHWPESVLTSTDGLLSFKIKPIKTLAMTDANGADVVQQFAAPVAP
jgi:hypothetical protein